MTFFTLPAKLLQFFQEKNSRVIDYFSCASKWLNNIPILIKPQIPTIAYTIFGNIDSIPNNDSTKLKSKKPINPQFMAPITVNINVVF